ncbi:glycosyltransferase family 2 protein [Candidatus Pelagibacter sp.]|jgi:glycosyltransferase involved in cell wall biosynthesis|uniref:glycosyltransferase family 2 protein n=1 Tax=uncultured Candidatus Pelagibacter sp. TaxID=372654 RepID=UPI002323D490|nr:glycosyltransferase family 2 protein [uncultured Candidatus Pelagibacter sp.]MDA7588064.1 glycosyltransferase family 2 protein [Candidatus Pelagibacter sp.]MDB4351234.1 glycosyltransferase family 2 protein [Candidatus Pelagibacter sp.]MDC0428084.1 glycosyltransferase family 2 protein [Candidatus Pelagibacter sp.]MDC1003450.1 glycosyltransferase family 2 protein [Candidatus Pelagibacter sp.]
MKKYVILIPIYNDRESLTKLIENINSEIEGSNSDISIIVVNDASSQQIIDKYQNTENINFIEIINMKENRGHARCIASGLKYIYEKKEFDYVIPMDGDGEDRPEEIKNFIQLAEQSKNQSIIGERVKRSESLFFKFCYLAHKIITLAFTSQYIKFGNFTCLSKSTVEKMLKEKATWNSFSGSLKKTDKNLLSIPSIRGVRYFGPSKMSFFNLLKHSLSIISVFRKTVLIRSALFIVFYILLIKSNASIITSLPLFLLLVMIYSISNLALRENLEDFNKSLENIHNIDKIK